MPVTPHDAWEHARRLLPGRVLRLTFPDKRAAHSFRMKMYRARDAARWSNYDDEDPAMLGKSPWDALVISLDAPHVEGEAFELRVARRADAPAGPIELSIGAA